MTKFIVKILAISLLSLLSIALVNANSCKANEIDVFHKAVQIGDAKTVRQMLEKSQQLAISADEYRFRPIHMMDLYFEPEILALLLANGADINAQNDDGITILHIITDPDAVALLVKNGANIEKRDSRGWTPIIMQANEQQNGPAVVEALIANGANVNAIGSNNETALQFAQETNNTELIHILVQAGAK